MFVRVHKDRGVERLYICRSVRNGSAVKSENVVSLGRIDKLCEEMNFTRDQVLAWADQKLNEIEQKPSLPVSVPFFQVVVMECHLFAFSIASLAHLILCRAFSLASLAQVVLILALSVASSAHLT